jgi:hypothetical protein
MIWQWFQTQADPTYLGNLTDYGGAVVLSVWYNGTNWVSDNNFKIKFDKVNNNNILIILYEL